MPDGTFRRPPQLWEQKLASLVAVNNVGTIAGTATDSVGSDLPPGDGGGGGAEPEPVVPSPVAFGKPSTPTLTGGVQSIQVTWNGLTTTGEAYPYESAVVEIHMSTTNGFTPDATTLRGTLRYPGSFTITGLVAGTTYYFRFRGRDAAGNFSTASDQASGQPGLTTSSDYGTATINAGAVSFNARQIGGVTTNVGTTQPSSPVVGDIWLDTTGGSTTHKRWNGSTWQTILFGSGSIADNAVTTVKIDQSAITEAKLSSNAVTAAKIAAGSVSADKIAANAVTADKIAANAITSDKIAANTITASDIAANTITGSLIAANTITSTNIGAGAITAGAIAAGAVTAEKISADAINGKTITGSVVRSNTNPQPNGGSFGAGVILDTSGIRGYDAFATERFNLNASTGEATITGNFRTNTSGARIEMGGIFGLLSGISLYSASGLAGSVLTNTDGGLLIGSTPYPLTLNASNSTVEVYGRMMCRNDGLYVWGSNVDLVGVYFNATSDNSQDRLIIQSNYNVRRLSSSQALKYDIAALSQSLSNSVESDRVAQVATIDPSDILSIAVTEYSVIDHDEPTEKRCIGFIAEDVADKFPAAVSRSEDGDPTGVSDTPMIAALLAVVQQQQQTIENLTARVTALEGA